MTICPQTECVNDGWQQILVGDPAWSDYTVAVDIWSYYWGHPIRIILRATSTGYMAFEISGFKTDLLLFSDGESRVIAHSDEGTTRDALKESEHHFRVEAKGDIYTAYVDGARVLQAQDGTYRKVGPDGPKGGLLGTDDA